MENILNDITGQYAVMYSDEQAGTLNVARNGLMTVFSCICSFVSADVLRLYCLCGVSIVPIGVMTPCSKNLTLSKAFTRNDLLRMGLSDINAVFLSKDGTLPPPLEKSSDNSAPAAIEPSAEISADKTAFDDPAESESSKRFGDRADVSDNIISHCGAHEDDCTDIPNAHEKPAEWVPEPEPWRLFSDADISESCRKVKGAYVRFDGDTSYLAVPISSNEPFPPMPIFCFGSPEKINGADYVVFTMKNGRFV